MGVLCDYFSGASDEVAASVISLPGSPGSRTGPGRLAQAAQSDPQAGTPFDTVAAKGIEPVVQIGTLEALLTGRDYDQIVAVPRAGQVLATQDGGERLVVAVTDELQAALADADDTQLASVAVPWSHTEEFFGQGDSA